MRTLTNLAPEGIPWEQWRKSLNIEDRTKPDKQTDIDAQAYDAIRATQGDAPIKLKALEQEEKDFRAFVKQLDDDDVKKLLAVFGKRKKK